MQALIYEESPEIALAYPNNIEAYRNDLVGNWTPVPGDDGYIIPNYNNVSMVTVEPLSADQSTSSSSPGIPVWGWGAIVLLVVGTGFVVAKRSGRSGDDEEG
jgi:peptide/nickel transport system substrate-binding protein